MRNGIFPDSPPLGSGKYCGSEKPPNLLTTSNYASVKYRGTKAARGFTLFYDEISQECGGQIILTESAPSTVLQSPNYPQIPFPHTECTWTILGIPGERIKIDFEFLDLTRSTDCRKEYVEVRDGGSGLARLINRYCQELPGSIYTSDSTGYLKFITDVDEPRAGFKARVSKATCGGTIRARQGTIHYSSSNEDPSSKNCTWHIIGPLDHTIQLHFNKFIMPCYQGSLSVSNINRINNSEEIIETYCTIQLHTPNDIRSSNNEVVVHFNPQGALKNVEFIIIFNTTQDGSYLIIQ